MSPEVQAAMVLVLAKRFGASETGGRAGEISPLGMARLVCGMSSDCRGREDCETCLLGGLGCCLFDGTDGAELWPGEDFRPAA